MINAKKQENYRMGKTRDLLKKIRDTKEIFHGKMGTIKDRKGMNQTKAENIKKMKVKVKSLSHVQLFATPWTVAHQAPPSKGFSRQEYWSGSPFPSPGDLPDPGIEPKSPTLQADSLSAEPQGKNTQKNYTKKILMTQIIPMV